MSFNRDVSNWVRASQARIDAVAKQSAQDVTDMAQKRRSAGGNMPVDTGFLVNSIRASTTGMPSDGSEPVAVAITRWRPVDQPLYIGWTANYAPFMEHRYAFMRLAAQQWQEIVDKNARKLASMRG